MHKEFVSIRWSQIPPNEWVTIVLVNPSECITMAIPQKGLYVSYKAYFLNKYIKEIKTFNMVFPYRLFERTINAIPPNLRQDLNRPIQITFMKTNRDMHIKEWKVL